MSASLLALPPMNALLVWWGGLTIVFSAAFAIGFGVHAGLRLGARWFGPSGPVQVTHIYLGSSDGGGA